jgi:hypothetical protein
MLSLYIHVQVVQSQLTLFETCNILHKKGMKLNAPFLSTKQPIYLFIIFMITSRLPPSFAAHFCTHYKTEKYLHDSP